MNTGRPFLRYCSASSACPPQSVPSTKVVSSFFSPLPSVQVRLTARPMSATAVPFGVYFISGSRVRFPIMRTLFKLAIIVLFYVGCLVSVIVSWIGCRSRSVVNSNPYRPLRSGQGVIAAVHSLPYHRKATDRQDQLLATVRHAHWPKAGDGTAQGWKIYVGGSCHVILGTDHTPARLTGDGARVEGLRAPASHGMGDSPKEG